jgi:streptogramin lyase
VLVAGGLGQGPFSTQLNSPTAIIVDGYGNLFILDAGNQRIQQFTPGSNVGVTIFDGSYAGSFGLTSYSMVMDSVGNLYVADYNGNRVQKISLVSSSLCTGKLWN